MIFQGVWQIGLDVVEAEEAWSIMGREESWRENSRLVKQEGISRGNLPLIIDSLHRYSRNMLVVHKSLCFTGSKTWCSFVDVLHR